MDIKNKKYLVVGLGKTGIETIRFMNDKNLDVRGSDISSADKLPAEINDLYDSGVKFELGSHSDDYLNWCDEIVLSPGVSLNSPFISKAVGLNKKIISEIELASRFIEQPIIAITGTNGKTTTTSLIGQILSSSGYRVFIGGNIGTPLISIAGHSSDYDFIVLETSSFQLQAIDKFKPFISVFLNISPNHLDHHKDFSEYLISKTNIFRNQTEDDWAIINTTDQLIKNHVSGIKARTILFGKNESNNLSVTGNNLISFRNELFNLNGLKLKGDHNLENAMCAVAVAKLTGCENETIEDTIKNFEPLPHRIEYIGNHLGLDVYNDSKSTSPDATLKAMDSISPPIILLAGGKDKGTDYSVLKTSINKKVKHLILFGEAKTSIKDQIGDSVCTTIANDLEEAVKTAFSISSENDTLLFSPACSSFDMFKSYEERGEEFKKIVENI
ncbi:MAG: UDP-N-acetylmuramoyl-L-alanine--D-glutamate ligase [Thermodesulfobacteriota bacterium]